MRYIVANKTHNANRASGGCLFGYKRSIQKKYSLEFMDTEDNVVIKAKFDENLVYNVMKYLNLDWNNEFLKLKKKTV